MFERFTDSARRVVVLSQEEARGLVHNYIGTEHILLGLFHARAAHYDQLLMDTLPDIPMDTAREQVTKIVPSLAEAPPGHLPFTPRAKRVLELSLREATRSGQNSIGPVHLLLGVLGDPESTGVHVLAGLGIDIEQLAGSLARATATSGSQHPAPAPVSRLDVLAEQVRLLTEQVDELRRRMDETGRHGEG